MSEFIQKQTEPAKTTIERGFPGPDVASTHQLLIRFGDFEVQVLDDDKIMVYLDDLIFVDGMLMAGLPGPSDSNNNNHNIPDEPLLPPAILDRHSGGQGLDIEGSGDERLGTRATKDLRATVALCNQTIADLVDKRLLKFTKSHRGVFRKHSVTHHRERDDMVSVLNRLNNQSRQVVKIYDEMAEHLKTKQRDQKILERVVTTFGDEIRAGSSRQLALEKNLGSLTTKCREMENHLQQASQSWKEKLVAGEAECGRYKEMVANMTGQTEDKEKDIESLVTRCLQLEDRYTRKCKRNEDEMAKISHMMEDKDRELDRVKSTLKSTLAEIELLRCTNVEQQNDMDALHLSQIELESSRDTLQVEKHSLVVTVEDLENKLSASSDQITALQSKYEKEKEGFESLRKEKKSLESTVEVLRDKLSEQLQLAADQMEELRLEYAEKKRRCEALQDALREEKGSLESTVKELGEKLSKEMQLSAEQIDQLRSDFAAEKLRAEEETKRQWVANEKYIQDRCSKIEQLEKKIVEQRNLIRSSETGYNMKERSLKDSFEAQSRCQEIVIHDLELEINSLQAKLERQQTSKDAEVDTITARYETDAERNNKCMEDILSYKNSITENLEVEMNNLKEQMKEREMRGTLATQCIHAPICVCQEPLEKQEEVVLRKVTVISNSQTSINELEEQLMKRNETITHQNGLNKTLQAVVTDLEEQLREQEKFTVNQMKSPESQRYEEKNAFLDELENMQQQKDSADELLHVKLSVQDCIYVAATNATVKELGGLEKTTECLEKELCNIRNEFHLLKSEKRGLILKMRMAQERDTEKRESLDMNASMNESNQRVDIDKNTQLLSFRGESTAGMTKNHGDGFIELERMQQVINNLDGDLNDAREDVNRLRSDKKGLTTELEKERKITMQMSYDLKNWSKMDEATIINAHRLRDAGSSKRLRKLSQIHMRLKASFGELQNSNWEIEGDRLYWEERGYELEDELAKMDKDLGDCKNQIGDLNADLDEAEEALDKKTKRIHQLERQIKNLKRERDSLRGNLKRNKNSRM